MLNHGFSSILLGNYSVGAFFAFFVKVLKHLRKCMPKWLPKCSKIELGAPWGSIFEVLGGFWKVSNFHEFWGRQKVSQKSENIDTWAAKGDPGAHFGAARRNERGRRGDFWGVRSISKACKTWNWAKSSMHLELGVLGRLGRPIQHALLPGKGQGRRI